ncbi:ATP-dependent DNA helicase [Vibrio viridaestus]|uniref:UvrD-like helicase C-terminal domain-containing protein n=1 Tax=Vibrio viridaestus TaxID=2487322 RepID=A0A3N9TE17_9VIBR|nr:AAA family ATPase [Vibrio viridaestus]RQW62074.1 hypothetical protein EES38_15245 [Vibrio viridaestus]
MNVELEVTSVTTLINEFVIYGNCLVRNKRLSIRIKQQLIFKKPCEAEIWHFRCETGSTLVNYRQQFKATEAKLTFRAFSDINSELDLYEQAFKQFQLPSLTQKLFYKHPEFRGIGCGKARIEKAIRKIGSARKFLIALKNENLPVLIDAFDSFDRAFSFLNAYKNIRAEFESIEFIEQSGYDKRTAHRLIKLFGRTTKEQLIKNPYSPIRLGSQFANAWGVAEQLRKRNIVDVAEDSPKRLIGAVDSIVYQMLKHNHTAIPEEQFKISLANLVGKKLVEKTIEIAVSNIALCKTYNGHYQGTGLAHLESFAEKSLANKINTKRSTDFNNSIQRYISEFDEYFFKIKGFNLTQEQKSLAYKALTNNFSLAQGAGGTGKSTAMGCVKYVCNRLNRPVYFVAVAGIAKKRVNDELRKMCILRSNPVGLLGNVEEEECSYTVRGFINQVKLTLKNPKGKNPILIERDPLIVFDESSMLDLSLVVEFLKLMDNCSKSYSISMIGDIAQIAPVGIGIVWQTMITLGVNKPDLMAYSELKSVHRQEIDNPIRQIADLIRTVGHNDASSWEEDIHHFANSPYKYLKPLTKTYDGENGVFYQTASNSTVIGLAYDWANQLGIENTQVITPYSSHDNSFSTEAVNEYFIEKLRISQSLEKNSTLQDFVKGDHIMVTKNNSILDLYNGDMGKIEDIVYEQAEKGADIKKKLICHFSDAGKTVSMDETNAFEVGLKHSYGITIHKTQGSEFKYTIVIIPATESTTFIENSMIYTALTRSQTATIFIGDMSTLSRAINSNPAYKNIITGFNLDYYFET